MSRTLRSGKISQDEPKKIKRKRNQVEDEDEEEQEEIDSSEKLATCLRDKKQEYEKLKREVLDIAYITSILDATINNNEIQNCGNLNMWINFRNLYNYELSKIGSSYPDRNKQAFMNMLFKLDSIHDFFGERTPYKGQELINFKDNVIQVLGWDDDKITDTVNAITKGHFENDLFIWLIFYGLRYIDPNINENPKYKKKLMLTESIQNYITRVSSDKNKSAFTIDAGLVDFITFRDFLKNISMYRSEEINIGDELRIFQYYKHIENIKENEFPGVDTELIKEAKICIQNILFLCLKNKTIYTGTSPSNKDEFFKTIFKNEEASFTKKGCERKYTHRFIANILSRIKGIKDRIKNTDDKLNPEFFKKDDILKIFITHSNSYFNDLIKKNPNGFNGCDGPINKTDLKEEKLIQKTFETLDTDSKEFKIISPQKFDSNRTTGGTWTEESIDKIYYLDGCNTDDEKKSPINKSNCSFQVLEDTCYFYSIKSGLSSDQKSSIKEFIFEIDNDNYPIKKIVVVSSDKFDSLLDPFLPTDKPTYKYKNQTLYCKNAPGVTELLGLYDYFSSLKIEQKGKKQKKEEEQLYEPQDVLDNILTIKRAGDYSQIWFCKRYNRELKDDKLFFMSNDRMSASFCLLEEVPFVCLIRNYGVYFNPFLEGPIEGSISYTMYSIPDKIKLIQNKNIQIMDNFSNCLGNKNVLKDYLSFINENKNRFINNDKDLTSILNYLDRIIFNQNNNNYIDDSIDEEKISLPTIQGEISGKKPLDSIYKYIENIAEKESQTLCTDILKNSIIGIFELDLEMVPEITLPEDDIIDEDIGKEDYLRRTYDGVKVVNALINTDDEAYQTVLQQELNKSSANIKCKNIVSIITNCVRLYNEFIKNIYKDINDKYTDDIDEDSIDYYISNYNVLLNCLTPIYNETRNNIVKKAIRYVLPDEFEEDISMTTPSSFAFSFENGLTYYKTYPSIPKKINTSKFKHANNVYVMDGKGYLKIEGSNFKGDIQLTNRNQKSVSYTDGTKISYYSF